MQSRSESDVKGIDVSHWEGKIDWEKVKLEGFQFAYVKASESTSTKDPNFSRNVKGAKEAGLLVGAYHFARPDKNKASDEAEHFVSFLTQYPTDLLPVLDLEEPEDPKKISVTALVQWVQSFINVVKGKTGRDVMLYTGSWFIDLFQQFNNALSDLPLWIANYRTTSSPPDNGGWTRWTIWQYSEKGKVSGIDGDVDLNVAGSLDELKG
ncbi:glycoside hydrolase family 25 protein [Paenibacillus alvei]|uniref:Glycoside hydrolase family 25 protein n=1 Tax=Paenibacillus alvei TaxID=44250 RepID=A0ABT4H569_PAEAL|nr:glycoside hydrolase family 25 protein [Paenibacillus alvei]EJW15361.1 N-acetylmuramoyl-L-alanine amidase [Paenibacillus alvei DSM 29]MCY7487887.1 glycoside hydrolase family 25 protein [Paenibacillus alvei]MCY9544501.1 glycoside hydrolase family 25 protein [Paenibacillus alvei]MCY9707403.1 glycoside hydrolase family 25 protein [Paenibacillus alvei]MCY9737890.1 glycoside hydrolase family 25 protein [Paenibacillus alvei]